VRDSYWRSKVIRPFSAHTPLRELVEQLNRYQPAVAIGYFSMIRLLTSEQEAGRLHIHPLLLQPAGETMTTGDLERIAKAFDARVRPFYAATECIYLSNSGRAAAGHRPAGQPRHPWSAASPPVATGRVT
jgi:phenylacetate-coenzyme A ligase PaaK-like adenylate-forming protein